MGGSRGGSHFGTEQWVDFVNGQAQATEFQAMQKHLDEGCSNCSKAAADWNRVLQVSKREAQYKVPESAVRHVRGAFGLMGNAAQQQRFAIPRLVFDSLWRPALSGVRASTANTPRQVLYKAGEVAVEMRLEPELKSERVIVAGQVSSSARQGEGLPEILVLVLSTRGILAETKTNRFGEFQLSFLPDDGLRISFGVVDGKELSIPLDGRGVRIFYRN